MLAMVLMFFSCKDTAVMDTYLSTGNEWDRKDVKIFEFTAEDSLQKYNLFINLRADYQYPYSNIYLIVKMHSPNGKSWVDTLQYPMATPSGELLGNGLTDLKESQLWFKSNYNFSNKGLYKIEIEHAMRNAKSEKGDEKLPGVSDVGLRIEKAI